MCIENKTPSKKTLYTIAAFAKEIPVNNMHMLLPVIQPNF